MATISDATPRVPGWGARRRKALGEPPSVGSFRSRSAWLDTAASSSLPKPMSPDFPPSDPAAPRAWGRVFAAAYDPFLAAAERAGMRGHRHDLLARADGRTLEIGAGTGLNLEHYPSDLEDLVVAEPDPWMRGRLGRAVQRAGSRARVIAAPAERLPVEDATIDTLVATLVLCTVDDVQSALREIARVLAPAGQLLLIEHVRSGSPALAGWQDRLASPWRLFAEGCHCNRDTTEAIDDAGFDLDVRPAMWRGMPPIVRPLIIGQATRRLTGPVASTEDEAHRRV
jgi:SAM-dependent methyltransferase